jgi:hypothetical protein
MTSWNPYAPLSTRKEWRVASTGAPLKDAFKSATINPRTGTKVTSDELAIGRNGEINASSKVDLMGQIGNLIDEAVKGNIHQAAVQPMDRIERLAALNEALSDRSGSSFQVLGEVIGEEIWETLGREGFARKIFIIKPLGKGETGRIRIRRKDVVSYVVTSNPNVIASQVRQFYLYPAEFYLTARILIEDKEIEQASGDLLDDKYQDGLEQMLVREDDIAKRLLDAAAPTANDLVFFNTFTPTIFTSLRTQVARWGIPPATAIIAWDLWNDIIADAEFSAWFDPVSKHEIVLEGKLGSLLDVELITDAFRYETLRVLNPGEVYMLGVPQTLGAITQRKELTTESINSYNIGRPERGWFMEQIEGMVVGNSRAVSKGQRA